MGKLFAIGTAAGIRVFEYSSYEQVLAIDFDSERGWNDVLFHPTQDILFVGGNNGVKMIDISSGKTIQLSTDSKDDSTSDSSCVYYEPACNPDGTRLVCGASDSHVSMWDIPSGKEIMRVNHDSNSKVESTTFDLTGNFFITGDYNNRIYVWETHTGKCDKVLVTKADFQNAQLNKAVGLDMLVSEDEITLGDWLVERGAVM